MTTDTVPNVAAMVVRVRKAMPPDLVASVSPKFIAEHCQIAWDNDWRDPEWLAKGGLAGTSMPNVTNAAAMFTAQFREVCATPCPVAETSAPPRTITGPNAMTTSAATPAQVAAHVAAARAAMGRSFNGEDR